MSATTFETLLALRNPESGWLAVLACVLDEASRDPEFDAHQRRLLAQLIVSGEPLPAAVLDAARQRADHFENELMAQNQAAMMEAPAASRPKLTLVESPARETNFA
ncbi:hypothetical protein [Oleiagrimonas sp. C23AA]|uniref:hypothetical protein n=1 Tax=Oleiagrimonas sp. C23AA TaxID=2719047 RepID=UPI00141E82E5|nr:hypothetical protein [Oleiagrimonas sp. C23AA]NII09319.1 hypothetical protein [Oleiagrimonas sp. C23AA]